MKAIQLKESECPLSGNNLKEITKEFGGTFEFEGRVQGERIITFKAKNGQEKLVRIGDWILKLDGVIVVLNNEEYKLLQSDEQLKKIKDRIDFEVKQYQHKFQTGIIKPPNEQSKQMIGNAVRKVIQQEKRQAGLLSMNCGDQASIMQARRSVSIKIKWPKL